MEKVPKSKKNKEEKKENNDVLETVINHYPKYIEINNQFFRVIHAVGYPRLVEAGFLDRVVSLFGDFNISLHINPFPIETMMINLNKELQKQRADLHSLQNKGIINPSLEIQHRDTRNILEALQKGEERLFNVSLYIVCRANTLDDLNKLTRKVESELNSIFPHNPAIFPASFVACRWLSLKYAGTVMTASVIVSPNFASASVFNF